MERESHPNFSIITEPQFSSPEQEEYREFSLEKLPTKGNPDRASALFGANTVRTEKIKEAQKPFFELMRTAMLEAQTFKSSKEKKEIALTFKSKYFAQLETRLLGLLAPLEHLYRNEKDVSDAILKMKSNFQKSEFKEGIDATTMRDFYSSGKGLFSALSCYRSRLKMPLTEGQKKLIYLQSELDAKADADFIEVIYSDRAKDISIDELNFIQVKSSAAGASDLSSIQRRHEGLAQELAGNIERLNNRYYPEVAFSSQDEFAEIMLNSFVELTSNDPDKKQDPIKKLNSALKIVTEDIRTTSLSNNGPIRLEANKIRNLALIMESASNEEEWLILYESLKQKFAVYTDTTAIQSLLEMRKEINRDPESYPHFSKMVDQFLSTFPAIKVKSAQLPNISKIHKIQSITTVGNKTVPNGTKEIGTKDSKYMVYRSEQQLID